MENKDTHKPILPTFGKSRWRQLKDFCPVARETFRRLSKEGRAPQPERMGCRITYFDNAEMHKWLKDPLNYRVQVKQ